MFDQEAIVETTNERTAIDSKWIITVLPRLKLADAKEERIARGINKAKYAKQSTNVNTLIGHDRSVDMIPSSFVRILIQLLLAM